MSNDDTPDDYEVGYQKPPKNTRFQKGVSGNPTGSQESCKLPLNIYERIRIPHDYQRQWTTKTYLEARSHSQTAAQQSVDRKHPSHANLCCSLPAVTRDGGAAIQRPRKDPRFAIHRRGIGEDNR